MRPFGGPWTEVAASGRATKAEPVDHPPIEQLPVSDTSSASEMTGGAVATRALHFIWICDCSGSMNADGKIQSLNEVIKGCIPDMREAAEHETVQVLVRVVTFSDGAQWHMATPTPVAAIRWTDLTADGVTDMGRALMLVAKQLRMPPMQKNGLAPVLALITDGQPTDDFASGLKALMAEKWGRRAVRVAIAIGIDAD